MKKIIIILILISVLIAKDKTQRLSVVYYTDGVLINKGDKELFITQLHGNFGFVVQGDSLILYFTDEPIQNEKNNNTHTN